MPYVYIRTAFGENGDLTAIPVAIQPDGSVSMDQGYGFDYQRDQVSDPLAKPVERDKQNYLFNILAAAIQQYQQFGVPPFITTSDNGGTPFSYSQFAYVRYDDGSGTKVYESLEDANTTLPTDTTKWRQIIHEPGIPVGAGMDYWGSTLPLGGWLWGDGKTIGSAASGATGRANADTLPIYTVFWNSMPNTVLPIQDSSGAPSSRGASAAADFAANKRLPIPDKRGRVSAAADNLGGTAAGRLTNSTAGGITGNVLGNSGGLQDNTLDVGQMPSHSHGPNSGANIVSQDGPGAPGGTLAQYSAGSPDHKEYFNPTTASSGSGNAHNNVQPTIICNYIFKL